MMMMDVGMYGHGQHNTSYSSTENYYNYTGETCPQNNHHMPQVPSSHYGTSYPSYEDPSYVYSENAETPPSPQDLNYYHHHHPQHVPQENPIISTDTGLSYTNLDYGTNATPTSYPVNHQPVYTDSYQRPQDVMLRHQDVDGNHHIGYMHENKYLPQIENDTYTHQHVTATNSSCMEYQHHHRFKEEGMPNDIDRHHHQQHGMHNVSSVPQPQPVIPTYKWMQVKRNVPKPGGMYTISFLSNKYHGY